MPCLYELKVLHPSDFAGLYVDEWSNALCKDRKERDVLAAWSNIKSVRNAIRCGFRPAWVELTARDCEFVHQLNL